MKTLLARLSPVVCAVLILQGPLASAAEPNKEMRAAVEQLAASQDVDKLLPALLNAARMKGIEDVKRGAVEAIARDPALSEAERARAWAVMDELAPQLAAAVDAQYGKLDPRAVLTDMIGDVYPKYYSADEMVQLAAYFASPSYRKVAAILLTVEQQAARTGQDRGALFGKLAAEGLSEEDNRVLGAFHGTALGRKKRALDAAVGKASIEYVQNSTRPLTDAALASYRETLMKRLKAAQPQ